MSEEEAKEIDAIHTLIYLIGFAKTEDEVTINSQEVNALEFMLEEYEKKQQKIDKAKKILNANTHTENIYEALCNLLLDDDYKYEICDEELLEI